MIKDNFRKSLFVILFMAGFHPSSFAFDIEQWNKLHQQMFALHAQGDKEESLKTALKILKIAQRDLNKDQIGYVEAVHHVGWLHWDLQRYEEAEGYFLESLSLYQALEEKNKTLPLEQRVSPQGVHGIGNEYTLLGLIYFSTERLDKAEECYLKAIEFFKNAPREHHWYLADIMRMLSEVYKRQGWIDQYQKWQQEADHLKEKQ